ncbi:MAG: hypothetical protein RLZ56_361 [Bacteroidota bacterium]|jgi:hypothetical protein
MAINKNHEFEDLDNIKCSIVEKNVSADRVQFLKDLLQYNQYQVVVVASPAPKAAATPTPTPVAEGDNAIAAAQEAAKAADESGKTASAPIAPSTFTVGVTDLRFNPTNAVFGRSLHTPDGHIVTLAFWNQEETISNDAVPYFVQHK